MKILDDIIKEKKGMYYNPFFLMHPENIIGFHKKRYKGFPVKYAKEMDSEIILFGDINYA